MPKAALRNCGRWKVLGRKLDRIRRCQEIGLHRYTWCFQVKLPRLQVNAHFPVVRILRPSGFPLILLTYYERDPMDAHDRSTGAK
ncbi:hypothetical protein JSE7799_02463 [Jannaschia seosinensis]|uniref:Uncharacterized protein n=1 Tax=Jannaschia seosinensis TaxID=313367 RepID=A0A0M7BEE4_9RHOB|nr:hypothetical protein JSE7799_02463 [Jannaschia seosinensis]